VSSFLRGNTDCAFWQIISSSLCVRLKQFVESLSEHLKGLKGSRLFTGEVMRIARSVLEWNTSAINRLYGMILVLRALFVYFFKKIGFNVKVTV